MDARCGSGGNRTHDQWIERRFREGELARLKTDEDQHQQEIKARNSELETLKYELQKAKDVGRSITVYDRDTDSERVLTSSELELVKMGEVFVDAACLMICDPGYIKEVWRDYDHDDYLHSHGDGTYSVYGEKFKDRIVRVYVDLL